LATFQHLETKEPPVPVLKEKMGIGEPPPAVMGIFRIIKEPTTKGFRQRKLLGKKKTNGWLVS
jgi:hypothetical protein